jgi:glycosyltransferase involved in cell wall biosynthesis
MDSLVVTVAVITYNSSKFIKETLESVKAQTYKAIKLIVSDDCSTDNTLAIVEDFILKNKSRFVSTKIVTSDTNTGVTANYSRAFDACDTEWMKELGGDDILMPDCIEDNMGYVQEHPDAVAVFSRIVPFETRFGKKIPSKQRKVYYEFFNLSREEQYHHFLYESNNLPGPMVFINVKKLQKAGISYDERIPLFEDYPMWITFLRQGVKFDFLDKTTVLYRIHKRGLSSMMYSPAYFKSNLLFFLYYFLDEIKNGEDKDRVYNLIGDRTTNFYKKAYYQGIKGDSLDYRIGHILLAPVRFIKKVIYYAKVLVWRLLH